jgi:hypothetical protein
MVNILLDDTPTHLDLFSSSVRRAHEVERTSGSEVTKHYGVTEDFEFTRTNIELPIPKNQIEEATGK